jgi:hypothetical protein
VQIDVSALQYLISAGIGWLAALVTFRTRLALIEKRVSDTETALKTILPALHALDRRSLYMLQLIAELAKASGIDRRVPDDLMVRFLTEDNGH